MMEMEFFKQDIDINGSYKMPNILTYMIRFSEELHETFHGQNIKPAEQLAFSYIMQIYNILQGWVDFKISYFDHPNLQTFIYPAEFV